MDWKGFIDGVLDSGGKLAKQELKDLIDHSKKDADDFVKTQGQKLELYFQQLADDRITKSQFKMFVQDVRDLTEMKLLQNAVAAKAAAQRIVDGIKRLIMDGLLALI